MLRLGQISACVGSMDEENKSALQVGMNRKLVSPIQWLDGVLRYTLFRLAVQNEIRKVGMQVQLL